jgi:hypothetical protein
LVCGDGNVCTDDSCDSISGCVLTNDDTNICSDGNVCTTNDACVSGVCVASDTTAPVLSGVPGDATVECSSVPAAATVTAADGCDGDVTVAMEESVTPGSCANAYTITRAWTAKDAVNNTATVSQTITVQDTTAPVLTVDTSTVVLACGASFDPLSVASATDSCGSASVSVSGSVNTSVPGTYTLSYTASDACGNASAAQTKTVLVNDNIAGLLAPLDLQDLAVLQAATTTGGTLDIGDTGLNGATGCFAVEFEIDLGGQTVYAYGAFKLKK